MTSNLQLSKKFLEQFYTEKDVFPNLLARATYLSKYKRPEDTCWTDTIKRVVEGNCSLDPNCSIQEAEQLFLAFWTMEALPPGRGLWTGGVDGIPADALYNCWGCVLRSVDDWCWMANCLMMGGGVGVSLAEINKLPTVEERQCHFYISVSRSHPDYEEIMPDPVFPEGIKTVYVEDSREGWIQAIREVFSSAFEGNSIIVNLSGVRCRGSKIRTFGGVSAGPSPLAYILRNGWSVIRSSAGKKLSSVNCLDITNHIGVGVKSGNVRRSAIIILGDSQDKDFREAKRDYNAVLSHRHSSNNSIMVRSLEEISTLDWSQLVEDNAEYGEPGLINMWKIRQTDPLAKTINPCIHRETLVQTKQGHFQIQDLVGKEVDVWDGKEWRTVNTFSITSHNEPIIKVTLHDGSFIRITPYHALELADGRRIEAKDAVIGDKLLTTNSPTSHGNISVNGAYLKGFLVGDGTSTSDRPLLRLYTPKYVCENRLIESAKEIKYNINDFENNIKVLIKEDPAFIDISSGRQERKSMQGLSIRKEELFPWSNEYKSYLPKEVFQWDYNSKLEFIAGVLDADGTASDTKNGFLYQIVSIHKKWLLDFQNLLKTIGVYGHLSLGKPAHKKDFGDGYGEYDCKETWRLTISQKNSIKLSKQVKFSRLTSFEHKTTTYNLSSRFNKIVSIEPAGIEEEVFCLVTEDPDKIALTNGIIIGRCGEVPLYNREACCLSEVFPARCDNAESVFELTTRYTLRQRLQPVSDATSDRIRTQNMRIGVGLGGVCDFVWSTGLLEGFYDTVRNSANKYAKELGVNRPIAVTVLKPSGSISLLNGSSPGIHAPFDNYYTRRIRLADNDPMVGVLEEAGVPFEKCKYDNSGHTYVFSFPMSSNAKTTTRNQTVRDQVLRELVVQNAYTDNAVSCTVSFGKDEKKELKDCLTEYGPMLKTISCLPKSHSYEQPPYETISKEEFESSYNKINHSHQLCVNTTDSIELEECQGGVCPIK